jgi:hypothetical protein
LWEEGEPKALAGDFLSSFKTMAPDLKSQSHGFALGWALFSAWSRNELQERATPFDEELIFVLVDYTIQVQSDLGFGLSLLLGFRSLLRVGEICGLQKYKVNFSAELATAVLELGFTKGGQRRGVEERISIDDPFLVRLLFLHLEKKLPGNFALKSIFQPV